jgi:conjugation system TraG family ATPase
LKVYDYFLTTSDAALCFFLKESLNKDEISGFQIRFTDRQGIPLKIDPADLPMQTNRINNRNKFVLGPSGSGKSFFMNALIEQYCMWNKRPNPKWLMDVVIVDTGHSYSGLCQYYQGKYITYTEEKPITTNPFSITEEEYNIEKKDYLLTLISLLWKTAEGTVSQVEADVISSTISAYYSSFFSGESEIDRLCFNSFYEFALEKIPEIKERESIGFELEEFRFVLKKFYKGGEFESLLNEEVDQSLFTESFVVFEIDSIKEHKVLFPIVTLIIMDVFIQKMRFRTKYRKALIIEEAWKAIASPLMAGYILYLYKTVRKFWGEAIVVTQELGDIIGNAVVKDSIINNSDTICLLDQTKFKDNYSQIASLLSINENERKKIFTINQLDNHEGRGRFKEVYIRRGSAGEVYGVEVSLYQYLTYTTEKPEKSAIEIYIQAFGGYQMGLDAFVEDFKASELSLHEFFGEVNKQGAPVRETLTATF